MTENISVLNAVALTEDLPEQELVRGQVGAVVEQLAPEAYEVEFVASEGRTYALLALRAEKIMALHYEPAPTGR